MITIETPREQSIPPFVFPQFFIVAPQSHDEPRETLVYPIETAPLEVFNAWLDAILDSEVDVGDTLFFMVIHAHRDTWDIVERWWVINALALYGVDMRRYYFESREEAERALKARQYNV